MRKRLTCLLLASIFSASISAKNDKPIDIEQLQRFSLQQQMPMASQYDIRMRKIVVKSGAKIGKHAHTERAGLVYVISGEITEFRNGKKSILKAGDSIVEDYETVHAYENNSDADCVLIAFDIPKSESKEHLKKYIK